jgi:kinetochore protein Mis13/DSN1
MTSMLEFKIDKLADGAHKLEQYRASAQKLADHVLSTGAEKLEERDKVLREKHNHNNNNNASVGPVDALERLRGLSRVLNRKA